MPAIDASRLLLFADAPRTAAPSAAAKIRRFRLARLRSDGARRPGAEPRYEYLKRGHD